MADMRVMLAVLLLLISSAPHADGTELTYTDEQQAIDLVPQLHAAPHAQHTVHTATHTRVDTGEEMVVELHGALSAQGYVKPLTVGQVFPFTHNCGTQLDGRGNLHKLMISVNQKLIAAEEKTGKKQVAEQKEPSSAAARQYNEAVEATQKQLAEVKTLVALPELGGKEEARFGVSQWGHLIIPQPTLFTCGAAAAAMLAYDMGCMEGQAELKKALALRQEKGIPSKDVADLLNTACSSAGFHATVINPSNKKTDELTGKEAYAYLEVPDADYILHFGQHFMVASLDLERALVYLRDPFCGIEMKLRREQFVGLVDSDLELSNMVQLKQLKKDLFPTTYHRNGKRTITITAPSSSRQATVPKKTREEQERPRVHTAYHSGKKAATEEQGEQRPRMHTTYHGNGKRTITFGRR